MVQKAKRLYFIDAMRAWAILMMLQGHFIDGLLDPVFRDPGNWVYQTWSYFRGITAPVFFTVSGFIFTYLILRAPVQGLRNPRLRKGIRRGLQLIAIGYLLRTNLLGLLNGVLYPSFFLVDVLHCIGISLLLLVGFYTLSYRLKGNLFPFLLLAFGLLVFVLEPVYKAWDWSWMPVFLQNYVSKSNGSIFTIIPWSGYAALGGAMSWLFYRFQSAGALYSVSIALCLLFGAGFLWYSSPFFSWMGSLSSVGLFERIVSNNYLFIRLGDVLIVFALFIILRKLMEFRLFLKIGQNTLSIYVIHFVILYGSFTGLGLYRFLHHSLSPVWAVLGALLFMVACTWLALYYDRKKEALQQVGQDGFKRMQQGTAKGIQITSRKVRSQWQRLLRLLDRTASGN